MTIADHATYKSRVKNPRERKHFSRGSITASAGKPFSTWRLAGETGTGQLPTTAVAPTNTTDGALKQQNTGGATQRILALTYAAASLSSTPNGLITIADRLGHHGGLDATSTAAQTTNLPTAPLPRYTTGLHVQAALEIYVAIGATPTTVQLSNYTSETGESGKVSPPTTFGGTGFNAFEHMIRMPLDGDRGVRAVASVQQAASTGTAGNYGVTLFMPLISVPLGLIRGAIGCEAEALLGFGLHFPIIQENACLWFIHHQTNNGGVGIWTGTVSIAEDT